MISIFPPHIHSSRWLIKDGKVDFSYSGEYNDARCGWCFIKEGKYDWDYVYTGK